MYALNNLLSTEWKFNEWKKNCSFPLRIHINNKVNRKHTRKIHSIGCVFFSFFSQPFSLHENESSFVCFMSSKIREQMWQLLKKKLYERKNGKTKLPNIHSYVNKTLQNFSLNLIFRLLKISIHNTHSRKLSENKKENCSIGWSIQKQQQITTWNSAKKYGFIYMQCMWS